MATVRIYEYSNNAQGTRYNVSVSPERRSRLPADHPEIPMMGGDKLGRRVHPAEERDRSSVLRSIREIRSIALSSDWDYFITVTLDPAKIPDRSDYVSATARLVRFFRNLRRSYSDDSFQYLLIPELHKDRVNYHFHGLMSGIPSELLEPHPMKPLREKGFFHFPGLLSKFGYNSLSPVTDTAAVSFYCLKYINKDLLKSSTRLNDGMRLYYVSRGVDRPKEIARFQTEVQPGAFAMDSEYGHKITYDDRFNTCYARDVPKVYIEMLTDDLSFTPVFSDSSAETFDRIVNEGMFPDMERFL